MEFFEEMPLVSLWELKEELAFSGDLGTDDDALMQGKIDAAQDHVERQLGYKIADQFGGWGQDPVPASIKHAVLSLAAHWYDARGATGRDAEAPYWVDDIISTYRGWTF